MNPPEPDLKAIFSEALNHAAGPERAAYLDRACGEDAALRVQVESLLEAHEGAGDFLGSGVAPASAPGATRDPKPEHEHDPTMSVTRPLDEKPGAKIGPYKLLQKIGEGGMGAVFMAEQEKPVRRKVALKVIKPGMDTGQVIARFEAERQALALMDHQNIAKVLDAGATDTGRPYFVMELVKGVPITEYCDRNHLTPKERLELFIPVCQAIQHAHQKGIIHRDIKPSNVLVTLHDGKPVPKVIDFGVAKAIDQRLTEKTMFTEFGAIIGTLEYMSPEQAEMGTLDIDTRSDIYSLGVMLYELLTGSTPLERAKLRQAAYSEVLRRIREEEPMKPSTRLSESKDSLPSISAQRKMEPARLTKLVRGDLDWIVMKSLEKDRTRRYETANGFARDVQRYLDGDPVEACPPSASYKLRKFARKHRAALATTGAFAVLLIVATGVSAGLAVWANRERIRAGRAENAATEQKKRAEEREQMAIDAVKRYGDVVRDTPELKNNPTLAPLRAKLLKEPQAFFKLLRDRLQADRETTPDSLDRLAGATFALGYLTNEIGDKQDALRAHEEALAIRERLARESPSVTQFQSDLAQSHTAIGTLQRETGRPAEAMASHEQARAIREWLARDKPSVTQFQSDLAVSHTFLGTLQAEKGRRAEALASYERGLAIRERLARENPSVTHFQSDLANSLHNIGLLQRVTGRPAKALASLEQACAIYERLARENPSVTQFQSDLALCHHNVGLLQVETSRPAEALASYAQSLAIKERLTRENPSVTEFQSGLASSLDNIGRLQSMMGRPEEARVSYERSLAIWERLARENPSVIEFQSELADSHNNVGGMQRETGQPTEAMASFERGLAIRERLARENPSVTQFQGGLANSHNVIALLRRATGRPAEALASFEQSRAIQERLAREQPESAGRASSLGGVLNNMALIDLDERQFESARAKLTRAIEWQRKALAANPNHPTYRQFLANHLNNLIRAAKGLGRADEAAEAKRERDELRNSDPKFVALDARLAGVLKGQAPKNEAERIQLAYRAYENSLHALSARLYTEAFANDPKLADSRQPGQHRYTAACAAALAGSGHGKDDPPPDDDAKAKLRRQAREWLQAVLAAWADVLNTGPADMKAMIAPTLRRWKDDIDLTGVRDEPELAKLPKAEREACKKLWVEVEALLAKTKDASP